ncbi:hypothetical protein AMECASPLE_012638 [Ameca splendens]|uniref:Uncharacterized protein n=1 Tax=Ameca splendens TaxID=208324 RepID=A0ABV0ZXX7_9TELE
MPRSGWRKDTPIATQAWSSAAPKSLEHILKCRHIFDEVIAQMKFRGPLLICDKLIVKKMQNIYTHLLHLILLVVQCIVGYLAAHHAFFQLVCVCNGKNIHGCEYFCTVL